MTCAYTQKCAIYPSSRSIAAAYTGRDRHIAYMLLSIICCYLLL